MKIKVDCQRCMVNNSCPFSGQSPQISGKRLFYCMLIGGYGKAPLDPSILSKESRDLVEKNGPYLTLAEIPFKGSRKSADASQEMGCQKNCCRDRNQRVF